MITLIGIAMFVIAEFLFDYIATPASTNWSILYFALTYLSFTLIASDLLFRESSKAIRYSGLSFAVLFIVLLIMELRFINVPFDEYIIGVNDNKVRTILFGLLSTFLIFISIMVWEKRLSKK